MPGGERRGGTMGRCVDRPGGWRVPALSAVAYAVLAGAAGTALAGLTGPAPAGLMLEQGGFVAVNALVLGLWLGRAGRRGRGQGEARAMARAFDRLAADTALAVQVKDRDGRIRLFNPAARRLFGPGLAVGANETALRPAAEAAAAAALDRAALAGGLREDEEILTTPAGPRRLGVIRVPLYDGDGVAVGVAGLARDLTEAQAAATALRQSEARLRALFDNMLGGFAFHQPIREGGRVVSFRYLAINARFEAETGLVDVVGRRVDEVIPDLAVRDRRLVEAAARVIEQGRPERFDYFFHALGRWYEVAMFRTDDGLLGVSFHDISDRKSAESRVEHLAFHDLLTGLPNRRLAEDRMSQAAAHADRAGSRAALLVLDLDGFKAINETLGHEVGDTVIRGVAARLRDCLRETDTLSRAGGDEFLIVLTDLRSGEAASTIAAKILARVAEPFEIQGLGLVTTASIGIAVHPDDGEDFATLLKKADTAMYQAKEEGRAGWRFFDERMNRDVAALLRLRAGLRRALDRGEFELYYQPQLDLAGGRVIGAEALLRWNHPDLGRVTPDRFIPLAEETGQIVPIGAWVLEQACRRAAAWQDEGLAGVGVAVNLSAVQLQRDDFDQTVAAALARSGLAPARLELELTESVLIKDAKPRLAALSRLKALGVRLAIDDFGTGYSSLSYLRRFAVDRLKIDRSFVADLADAPGDDAIVRAVIQMAHSLGLRAIAEGVETEAVRERLRALGCDEIQGYLLARPLPADAFVAFVRAHHAGLAAADSAGGPLPPLPILADPA